MGPNEKYLESNSDDQRDDSETINADDYDSNVETPVKKMKYPKSIGFIISNEFCERFNYYGMRTILTLYLTFKLDFNEETATVIYHSFTSLAYLFPLFGAILADSFLGKFKTILYLSMVYAAGSVLISVGAIPTLNLPTKVVTIIGLLLIAIGTGGIKPCVSAFGGDQFKIPQQIKQLATFFSLFYMAINAGSLISTFITPILREDVKCFGQNDCFSLAFGVPGILMVVSIFIFIFGRRFYVVKKPSGNMIVLVSKCVANAIKTKSAEKSTNPKEHLLDYSEAKYGKQIIADIRAVVKILVLYLPLPIFWSLYDQQGSRWTFQATRMTGELGSFTLKPDQMQVVNPLLILLFVPLFDYVLYPLLAKVGIKRPLQKLVLGGMLAATAFVVSALLELKLEDTYPVLPQAQESQLRIFNGMPCTYNFETDIPDHHKFTIKPLALFEERHVPVLSNKSFTYQMTASPTGPDCPNQSGTLTLTEKKSISYFITEILLPNKNVELMKYEDDPNKTKDGVPILRVLVNLPNDQKVTLKSKGVPDKTFSSKTHDLVTLPHGNYEIFFNDKLISSAKLNIGGVYTMVINANSAGNINTEVHVITVPNSVNMLWLLPQYIIITAGEIMFSITGLEFSFTQAPASMKSVLQAYWLLTVSIGNIVVVAVAEAKIFESQAYEFFLFAALMVADMVVFTILAMRYKYVEAVHDDHSGDEANDKQNELAGSIKKGVHNEGYQDDTINV